MNPNIDDMLAQLCQDVNNKNVEMEKRSRETDIDLMASEAKPTIPYNRMLNPEMQANAVINKTFQVFKERAEVSNLTDSFRTPQTEETRSKTTRSLATVTDNYTRYSTILQEIG